MASMPVTRKAAQAMRLSLFAGICTVLAGCEGAMWGNLAVLIVSVGIFVGTLSLGRVGRRE
jgi:hypothetical protein